MNTLFPLTPENPEGFTYFPGFLTIAEEENLLSLIRTIELKNMNFRGYEAKRKTASFGFDWNFDTRKLSKGHPIPAEFEWLITKAARQLNIEEQKIAELLITEYPKESVINWHRDAPPFDTIIGISLLSDCIFRFRPYGKENRNRKSIRSLTVARRSLYVMKGESRSQWEHSIAPVKQERFSITLRTLF